MKAVLLGIFLSSFVLVMIIYQSLADEAPYGPGELSVSSVPVKNVNWHRMAMRSSMIVDLDSLMAYELSGLRGLGTVKEVKSDRIYFWETYKTFKLKGVKIINLLGEKIGSGSLKPGDPLFIWKTDDKGKVTYILDAFVGTEGDVMWCNDKALLLSTGQKFYFNGYLNCRRAFGKKVFLRINPLDWKAYYISFKKYDGYFFLRPGALISAK